MGPQSRLDVEPQLAGQLIGRTLSQHHERLHDMPLDRIGFSHDRGLRDRVVADERALDIERSDAVPRALDDIVRAAGEIEVAVRVTASGIAGQEISPIRGETFGGATRLREAAAQPRDRGR